MIKFRAWNGAIKVLAQVTEIRFDQLAVLTTDSKFLWDMKKCDLDQCTGLKDINGHEIYEGDIVRVCSFDTNDGYVDVIQWGIKHDYPAFDLKKRDIDYESNALSAIVNSDDEYLQVIGDIHNNPDLLLDVAK